MLDLFADLFLALLRRRLLACAVVAGAAMSSLPAWAQLAPPPPEPVPQTAPPPPPGAPPPQAGNPVCARLEAQLATVDRGGSNDPAKDDQIRRYQDAASRQQGELDRLTAQARRMGCDSSGFFSLFSARSAQCGPINQQIQQMRANLDQMMNGLEQLRGGGLGADRDAQRRSVLIALGQNNCGPQYAQFANAATGPAGFLSSLFGNAIVPPPGPDMGPPSGTYRTVCVRTCDGGYFPISFATVPARFPDDEKACKEQCPATEANLFAYRNPGEDINQAVSVSGQPYTSLPNAFRYRTEYSPACSCRAPGQTWADALKSIDDKSAAEQQGDIIVTEESAKRMQRPQERSATRKGAAAAPAAGPQAAGAPAATTPAPGPDKAAPGQDTAAAAPGPADPANKQIRTVGPPFIPAR